MTVLTFKSTSFGLGRWHGRSVRLGAAAGVGVGLVLLLLVVMMPTGTSSGPSVASRQAEVTSWEASVRPLLVRGGEIVVHGPRGAGAQLTGGTLSPAMLTQQATGWVRRLTDLRLQIAAVSTPAVLRSAHDLLDSAMAGYVTASRDLLAAARATGSERVRLLDAAAAAGQAADADYDKATAAVAHVRSQLNLSPDWSG